MILTEFDEALHEKTMRELGREEGREEERKAGELRLEKERESNIQAVISMCQNMHMTKEQSLEQLLKAFAFDETTLVTYLDRFWK